MYVCDLNVQVGALLGFSIPNYSGQSVSLFRTYVYAFSHLSAINWAEVICAISSIVLMVLIKKARCVVQTLGLVSKGLCICCGQREC
jgi:hypothetical protein